jgi:hypothetical protein
MGLQQPAVRSMKWVGDFSRLESAVWRWLASRSSLGEREVLLRGSAATADILRVHS